MKTTRQLAQREAERELYGIELSVDQLLQEGREYHDAMRRFQRAFLRRALVRSGGNVTTASKIIGVHRNTFPRLLQSSGLRVANSAKAKRPNGSGLLAYNAKRRAA